MGVKALLAVGAAVCLVASGGLFVEAWRSTTADRHLVPAAITRIPLAPPVTSPPMTILSTDPSSTVPLTVSRPVTVTVPAVGLSAGIVPVGLDGNGQIDVPAPSLAGWYQPGPAPGAVGPAVLVGHVDTRSGAAVFYRLTAARPGDEIDVGRADGSQSHFVISAVTTVKKAAFPADAVFARTSGAAIRLITCTGPFNPRSHHYVDSLIVWGTATA
jgi:Sortase domain